MIDLNKPIQTRDGWDVRILCADKHGNFPICGILKTNNGEEYLRAWTINGSFCSGEYPSPHDLVNIPEKHVGWLNIYTADNLAESKEMADAHSVSNRIACVKVEWKDGEGLGESK